MSEIDFLMDNNRLLIPVEKLLRNITKTIQIL